MDREREREREREKRVVKGYDWKTGTDASPKGKSVVILVGDRVWV